MSLAGSAAARRRLRKSGPGVLVLACPAGGAARPRRPGPTVPGRVPALVTAGKVQVASSHSELLVLPGNDAVGPSSESGPLFKFHSVMILQKPLAAAGAARRSTGISVSYRRANMIRVSAPALPAAIGASQSQAANGDRRRIGSLSASRRVSSEKRDSQ